MSQKRKLLISAIILILIFGGSGTVVYHKVRGFRNKNPGNIRDNGVVWRGQEGVDSEGFVIFSSVEYGLRALMRILKNYETIHGLRTVRQIIYRWAPPTENNTESYIKSVAQYMGQPDHGVELMSLTRQEDKDTLIRLSKAIVKHELGFQPYTRNMFNEAWELERVQ